MARAGTKPIMSHTRSVRFASTYPENEAVLAWLRSEAFEEVLEPELPIVDSHHHLGDLRGKNPGQWKQIVYKLPEILEDAYDGHNVVKTVFVQANAFTHGRDVTGLPDVMRPLGEVEYCQGVAALCDSATYGNCRVCAGIIGTADFQDPNLEKLLQAQMGLRNFRGIRTGIRGTGTPVDADDAAFCRGIELLQKYDLVYDYWHDDYKRLPELKKLALKFPGVKFVIDHMGGGVGPAMGQAAFEQWKKDIADVASCPNVLVKVGFAGDMAMDKTKHVFGARPTPMDSRELCEVMLPYYGHVIDSFTPQRCMFQGGFPACKSTCSARVQWNTCKRVAAAKGLSAADKKSIFHDTAVKTYRLDEDFYAKL